MHRNIDNLSNSKASYLKTPRNIARTHYQTDIMESLRKPMMCFSKLSIAAIAVIDGIAAAFDTEKIDD